MSQMMPSDPKTNLGNNTIDMVVAAACGVAGTAPFVGGAISEFLKFVIPNQRLDRFQRLLEQLSGRLGDFTPEKLQERLRSPEFSPLFQQCLDQAARTSSNERLRYLAALLRKSLDDDLAQNVQSEVALRLLGQLSDIEIIMLKRYSFGQVRRDEADEFMSRYPEIFKPRYPSSGSSLEEREEADLYESFREHLITLRLIRSKFRFEDGEPKYDFDGKQQIEYRFITHLGRVLLEYIDEAVPPSPLSQE